MWSAAANFIQAGTGNKGAAMDCRIVSEAVVIEESSHNGYGQRTPHCDSHSLMISVKDSRAETSGEVSMGGDGSGRRCDSKATTADYCHFDVRRWQRKGLLVKFGRFIWEKWQVDVAPASLSNPRPEWVILTNLDRQHEKYPIQLDWTPCHYGGSRPWFRCPTKGCGLRVAILYVVTLRI